MRYASRLFLASGYTLLKIKSQLPYGEFEPFIEKEGYEPRRARELMAGWRLYTRATPEQRKQLASIGKSKMLLLASADPEIVEAILGEDETKVDGLTYQQLRNEINALRADKNRIQADLNTANAKLAVAHKALPPPLISRETDAFLQKNLNAEAMGTAAHDILSRQIKSIENGTEDIEERVMSLHCCLTALACRAGLALERLHQFAEDSGVLLPERPRMAVSESMARDYLEAHTGYIQTAIEIAEKALIAHGEPVARGRGRPAGSKSKKGATQ